MFVWPSICELEECRSLVASLDHQGLLNGSGSDSPSIEDDLDDDALLTELGVEADTPNITELKHVRPIAEKRAAEEIANRERCEDFDAFEPLFEKVRRELKSGERETRPFQTMAEIKKGEFFIVSGQIAYVADTGDEFVTQYDRRDSRLRVIYDNKTESNVLFPAGVSEPSKVLWPQWNLLLGFESYVSL